ncbi:glutamate dehydrogenase, partial [Streptomyces hydrogenans]
LPEAEEALAARGVTVLPDVVVNSCTNAWWWWTLFGDVEADADQSFARVRSAMRDLTGAVLDRAEADGVLPRTAAHALVAERLPVIAERYGWY